MTFEYKVYLCCILMFIPSLIDCNSHVRDKVFYDINGQMFLLMTKNENTGNEQYNYLLAQDTVTVSIDFSGKPTNEPLSPLGEI